MSLKKDFNYFLYFQIKNALIIAVTITEIKLATKESNPKPSGACNI